MTTPDRHPERIAATVRENDTLRGYRYTTHGDADANGNRVYVREDVAEAAVAYDRGPLLVTIRDQGNKIEALDAETTALRRDLDSLQGQANMHIEGLFNQSATIETLKTETTALRRERDAAVEHAAAFAEVSRIVGISYEADGRPVVPGPTDVVLAEVSEILVAANQSRELKSERDAVRRERDALAAEAEGLRKHIAAMVDLYERATANDTDEMPADDWAVYQAARAEMPAGKGVG